MKDSAAAIIMIGFFALIGIVTYITNEPRCLWALLLMPTVSIKSKSSGKDPKDETDKNIPG